MMNEKELPVYAALDRMGIEYTRIEHPAAATMEACAAIGEGTGASHCKNLFLTNRQGTAFFLVMLGSSKKFRTASVSKQLGVARLSFTTAEQLEKCFHRLRKAADEGFLLPLKPDIAGQYRTSADNFLKTSLQNKRF